ncbi:glucan endo-1,3-beta-glucosidase 6 [Cucumis melo var. makuwa]|uniref:glucan endo-1,3-beta-D-glucosidase n=1 Tax=Cucumis melo var. makuwa TaxID=1194695 RepID=A0A5D3CT91_CUCMM|nr:glucan endo-1,3-beta-glucosidase 6 [Cucumis melo var. makuwa]TYK14652.1 glucan endo-1,3-beta-glucosidase 6 [Cucumis melo var. makuwa]
MGRSKLWGSLLLVVCCLLFVKGGWGFACNWGTRSSHPLPPDIVVKLMKDNGFNKVKLFEADPGALQALGNSGLQVMLGIPNEFLASLASSVRVAENWVAKNVSYFVSNFGTNIRYVAVGNEPFLNAYNGSFLQSTFPALQNIQAALIKAGLGRQVKVTIPLNADVYETSNGLPSGGNFRPDIRDLMVNIIKFLNNNASPLTINIYPFLSLNADPHFPKEYAFFSGNAAPVIDGSISYTNVLDANFDTLVSALEKNGFSSMPLIIGEVGWPTDGDPNANKANAQRFNQGLIERINRRQGTPKRPVPTDTYIFAIIDEDAKSIQPGSFERHWGVFNYDGTIKYSLNMGNGKQLVPAKGVQYLSKQWCVMSPQASLSDPNIPNSVAYACDHADCTSLSYGSSCSNLDAKSNVSYAFNAYFQTMNQSSNACKFSNLATISTVDPSPPNQGNNRDGCRFGIMIDTTKKRRLARPPRTSSGTRLRIGQKSCWYWISFLLVLSILIMKN